MKVLNGHNVKVHYKGTLNDGTEFDNSRNRGKTLNFEVGARRMIPGFSAACVGMVAGEKKEVVLSPEEAYGQRDPEAIQVVPKQAFGENFPLEVGGTVQGNGPQGVFFARIQEVQEADVVLDMNHPLAGEVLNFEIEMVEVENTATAPVMARWDKSMKKAKLLELAKEQGLPVNTRSTKTQIIEALQTV